MAKKRIQPGGTQPILIPEAVEVIPDVVNEAADLFLKAQTNHKKHAKLAKNAHQVALQLMRDHGIKRMRIDDGKQWLEVADEHKLKTRKAKPEKDFTEQGKRA